MAFRHPIALDLEEADNRIDRRASRIDEDGFPGEFAHAGDGDDDARDLPDEPPPGWAGRR